MTQKSRKSDKKIERGLWLSIWLILIMLHSALAVILVMASSKDPSMTFSFPVLVSLLFIANVAKFVAAIAIWRWEKWGLQVYAGAVVVAMVIGLMMTGSLLIVFNDLLPLAILGWLVRDKWANFGIQ